jgi:hypothetical protein
MNRQTNFNLSQFIVGICYHPYLIVIIVIVLFKFNANFRKIFAVLPTHFPHFVNRIWTFHWNSSHEHMSKLNFYDKLFTDRIFQSLQKIAKFLVIFRINTNGEFGWIYCTLEALKKFNEVGKSMRKNLFNRLNKFDYCIVWNSRIQITILCYSIRIWFFQPLNYLQQFLLYD